MYATLRIVSAFRYFIKTVKTTLSITVSVLSRYEYFKQNLIKKLFILKKYLTFTGSLDALDLFARAKKFGFHQLFRGLTRKNPNFFSAQKLDPKKPEL